MLGIQVKEEKSSHIFDEISSSFIITLLRFRFLLILLCRLCRQWISRFSFYRLLLIVLGFLLYLWSLRRYDSLRSDSLGTGWLKCWLLICLGLRSLLFQIFFFSQSSLGSSSWWIRGPFTFWDKRWLPPLRRRRFLSWFNFALRFCWFNRLWRGSPFLACRRCNFTTIFTAFFSSNSTSASISRLTRWLLWFSRFRLLKLCLDSSSRSSLRRRWISCRVKRGPPFFSLIGSCCLARSITLRVVLNELRFFNQCFWNRSLCRCTNISHMSSVIGLWITLRLIWLKRSRVDECTRIIMAVWKHPRCVKELSTSHYWVIELGWATTTQTHTLVQVLIVELSKLFHFVAHRFLHFFVSFFLSFNSLFFGLIKYGKLLLCCLLDINRRWLLIRLSTIKVLGEHLGLLLLHRRSLLLLNVWLLLNLMGLDRWWELIIINGFKRSDMLPMSAVWLLNIILAHITSTSILLLLLRFFFSNFSLVLSLFLYLFCLELLRLSQVFLMLSLMQLVWAWLLVLLSPVIVLLRIGDLIRRLLLLLTLGWLGGTRARSRLRLLLPFVFHLFLGERNWS